MDVGGVVYIVNDEIPILYELHLGTSSFDETPLVWITKVVFLNMFGYSGFDYSFKCLDYNTTKRNASIGLWIIWGNSAFNNGKTTIEKGI